MNDRAFSLSFFRHFRAFTYYELFISFRCLNFGCNINRINPFAQDAVLFLIVIISMIHDFFSFYIVVSKCEEWKEKVCLWSVPGDINIATPLQLTMRWDITSLVHSVNPICAKKVYYSNRPKYFFLCVNSRITSKIFKTCFGQSEQVWMD